MTIKVFFLNIDLDCAINPTIMVERGKCALCFCSKVKGTERWQNKKKEKNINLSKQETSKALDVSNGYVYRYSYTYIYDTKVWWYNMYVSRRPLILLERKEHMEYSEIPILHMFQNCSDFLTYIDSTKVHGNSLYGSPVYISCRILPWP